MASISFHFGNYWDHFSPWETQSFRNDLCLIYVSSKCYRRGLERVPFFCDNIPSELWDRRYFSHWLNLPQVDSGQVYDTSQGRFKQTGWRWPSTGETQTKALKTLVKLHIKYLVKNTQRTSLLCVLGWVLKLFACITHSSRANLVAACVLLRRRRD